jgi:hypothetical protein
VVVAEWQRSLEGMMMWLCRRLCEGDNCSSTATSCSFVATTLVADGLPQAHLISILACCLFHVNSPQREVCIGSKLHYQNGITPIRFRTRLVVPVSLSRRIVRRSRLWRPSTFFWSAENGRWKSVCWAMATRKLYSWTGHSSR